MRFFPAFLACITAAASIGRPSARADDPKAQDDVSRQGAAYFEKHIRPLLANHCFSCHSSQARPIKGGLRLDSREGTAKGGAGGPAIVAGFPDKSRLVQAVRWSDPDLAMPPGGKISAEQIAYLEEWIRMGAPDPRLTENTAVAPAVKAIDIEAGRQWWAFRPVTEKPASPSASKWPRNKIDFFVLKELEAKGLAPSPRADARTLIQRANLDLIGLRPTYDEIEEFAAEDGASDYEEAVDRLLASPLYGQRWGRYWLDVARYGEDNPTSEATNPPYPFAWRYRDWVIDAFNRDVPYDQFVSLQLAADLLPHTPRRDLHATGFLGAGPVYHKDARLSREVIENLYMDDWDERVDVLTRGVLGVTVACARCHDHKFDPFTSKDYYALASVFASTVAAPRPLADVDAATETRFMTAAGRLFYLSYVANLLHVEPGSKAEEARRKVERFVDEINKIAEEIEPWRQSHPQLHAYLSKLIKRPAPFEQKAAAKTAELPATEPMVNAGGGQRGRRSAPSTEPFFHSVFEAGLWVKGDDVDLTMIDVKPAETHNLPVFVGGNVSRPGPPAPRGFPQVLSRGDPAFHQGSGRLELARRLFTDAAPLSSRVIVNRVWGWHFGRPLVETTSDFGAQGERPSHPELLDDLAARFIAHGWSLKWLHREIMLSATYQQSSRARSALSKIDPNNRLLWRMNPRRLDIEAYRDCLLQGSGELDIALGGPSLDLDLPGNRRRTVYGRIGRGRASSMLRLFDFPEATMHSPTRETSTTAFQQLFVLNSPFMQERAKAAAQRLSGELSQDLQIRTLFRQILVRDPEKSELGRARQYLRAASLTDFAHALLSTNEVIFWP